MNDAFLSGYEKKFADFIRMCAELRAKGVPQIVVASPSALGDTHAEMVESLSRIADAGLTLHIAAREPRPSHN